MRPLFYDLTELLYLSHGFKTYYGIAKVVAEGAKEAFRANNGTRFVAYSQGHDAFFEIFPKYDDTAEGGIDLNVPNSGKPFFHAPDPQSQEKEGSALRSAFCVRCRGPDRAVPLGAERR